MTLSRLDIASVRNIQQATLYPAPALNFIYGANASGKSALLEAIFLLGRARSFRSSSIKPVIHFSHDHLMVTAQTVFTSGAHQHVGVKLDTKTCDIRINQQTMPNKSSLAYALPLQLIYPKSYELLDGSPQARREFLDWGVFHHDPAFLPAWRNYKKVLAQRNALLKNRQSEHLKVWSQELAYYGTIVTDCRRRYLEIFSPVFQSIAGQLLELPAVAMSLSPGWDNSESLLQILTEDAEKDLRYGFTQNGPHRADLMLTLDRLPARDIVSRGQLKLLVISLKLAQVQLLNLNEQDSTCILFDDFAAELDVANRAKVLRYISNMQCQAFLTATSPIDFGDLPNIDNYKMFHVEHGEINPVDCSMWNIKNTSEAGT
ncbi:DNA replication/repair protein RecF [Methylomicrobium sp. Wu6]|uniref:DNA replication/repair protein RecF n=1 Tax=Methylomicrobium sp. Wu6 TaxID=3107928 RepID=UPI002DD69C3E|nr:DNA replication/repair protein RecF [Methylomicrobium sp. Wu6]MEC4749452.1 DNA replication/repair protein RecF [Methylomicrobium sp. Wu6]